MNINLKNIPSILPLIFLPTMSFSQNCTIIDNNNERLTCYDKTYRDVGGKVQTPNGWSVIINHDKMNKIDVWHGQNHTSEGNTRLQVFCSGPSARIAIVSDEFIGLNMELKKVMIKIDDDKPYSEDWMVTSKTVLQKLDTDKKIIQLIDKLSRSNNLMIRYWPYDHSAITAEFSMSGIGDVIKKVRQDCPRKEKWWKK